MSRLEKRVNSKLAFLLAVLTSIFMLFYSFDLNILSSINYDNVVDTNKITLWENLYRWDPDYTSRMKGTLLYTISLCRRIDIHTELYRQYISDDITLNDYELTELLNGINEVIRDCSKYDGLVTSENKRYYLNNATVKVCKELVNFYESRLEQVLYDHDTSRDDLDEKDNQEKILQARYNILMQDIKSTSGMNSTFDLIFLAILIMANSSIYGSFMDRDRRYRSNSNALSEHFMTKSILNKYQETE